ncbi:MAG: fimbria/pilus outer membrane usher protein [Acidobacteriota bacterium]
MKIWSPAVRKRAISGRLALCLCLPMLVEGAAMKESLLTVRVNGILLSESEPILELEPGRLFVPASIFRTGRLRLPAESPTHVSGVGLDYFALDAIVGAHYSIDESTQAIDITVPASAFSYTTLDGLGNVRTRATRPDPGLFLNHDFQMFYSGGRQSLSGLLEGGFFSRWGVLTTQFAGSDLINSFVLRRLNTQFFHDFPQSMTTLTLGDSFSAVSPWARTVAYAGVRYASKFATQPGFVPTPLPGIAGQASQPSMVDVYVDNVKRLSQPVAAGPFAIQNVPVISGQGEIRMVVTDLLGRQQVITESYIRSSQLLRAGVSDFTYEAGTLRLLYGIKNNQYRSFFAAATYRRGISDTLTLEGRAETQLGTETAGLGAVYAIRSVGTLSGGMAASMERGRPGQLLYAGYSRSQQSFGFAAQMQMASPGFRQVGLREPQKATRLLLQAQVSKSAGDHSTFAAGYLRRDGRTEQDVQALTGSVNVRLYRGFLTVGGTYSLLSARPYGLSVALVMPLGERTIAMASGESSPGSRTASMEVSRSIPLGPGIGYRVRTSNLDDRKQEAAFYYQNYAGSYGVEGGQGGCGTSVRLLERGSVVLLHRHLMVSRWLNDSFGVVEVPNAKGVPVYVNNQVMAKTDRWGFALVPWLVAYNRNSVRLDDAALPVDMTVDLEERMVVPMARSAAFVRYQPASVGGATLVLETRVGEAVPQGAMVTVNTNPAAYEVELRGEVFVIDIDYPAVVHAAWPGRKCDVRIAQPPANTPVPKIGPLTCKEIK